jgi:iron complex outermembrane receptor protein
VNSVPANISQPPLFGPNGEIIRPRGFAGTRNPTIPDAGATADSCLSPTSFPTERSPFQCRFDFASVIDTIPEVEKTSAVARLTSRLGAFGQFFAEGSYYRGSFIYRSAATPVNSNFTLSPMTLPPTSPYYPAAFVASIGGDTSLPVFLSYRTVELGPRVVDATVDQWRVVMGLQGEKAGWEYQAAANFVANAQVERNVSGLLSEAAFGPLLRSGVVNPFGPNSEDVLRQMRAAQVTGKFSDNRASNIGGDFKLSRDLLRLPTGPLAVALGVEGRREDLEMTNEEVLYSGDIIGGSGALPSVEKANRTVWSLFAEANIPVLPKLEANLAVRMDHYSDFGSTTNPKLTLRWQPAREVVLRASYGSGFRAPSLIDLYLPPYYGFIPPVSDPIRCPVTQSPLDCDTDFLANAGGNPGLKPEKSRQSNVGIVLEPSSGMSISVDYYWIKVRDIIDRLGPDITSDRIVRGPPDPQFPNLPGPIILVLNVPVNIATLKTSGIEIDFRWRVPATGFGRFAFALNGTYVLEYDSGNTLTLNPSGPGRVAPVGGAISRWRHYASIDWTRGPWGATLAQNFQNGYSELDLRSCDAFGGNCTADRRVGSYEIWDFQARYNGLRNFSVALGVRNLFDRAPPWSSQPGTFQVGYDSTYADPRGRTYYASVRYSFR